MDKLSLLKRYWGYSSFRPMQEEIIDSVSAGHDVLVTMPTGGGKSLCYQLPALMTEGLCIVVSPLIALMKDQVHNLNKRGIKSACIVSGMSKTDAAAVLTNCISGTVKLLYVSPERLRQQMFIEHLRRMQVGLIAVDEAHCVSQWGYDFRPPYLQIADIRNYQPKAPMIALTATATSDVAEDIKRQLHMRDCMMFSSTHVRPNLCYRVEKTEDKVSRLIQLVNDTEGSGIVYTRSRKRAQQLALQLEASGVATAYYHAGLDSAERDKKQALWMSGKCRVMVATSAFGMGIDKADVRFVVHTDMPDSLEAYYQEAGRAGRDGKEALAVAIYSPSDTVRLTRDHEASFPSVKYIRNVYRALCNYYKVPVGSGAETRHNLDMEAICSTYGLELREFYSACRFLERLGLIAMPEREDAFSTLFVPLGRDEVYRFQLEHLRFGPLLQVLVRMYSGLFMSPVAIDERKVAGKAMLETTEVIGMLNELSAMNVVEYVPRARKPQIIFTSERIDEKSINLKDAEYDFLRENALARLNAVFAYVDNGNVCRSRQLAAYFGEGNVADCGVCDVCRNRRQQHLSAKEAVEDTLRRCALPMQELCRMMKEAGYANAVGEIREMLDEGRIYMDRNSVVSIS